MELILVKAQEAPAPHIARQLVLPQTFEQAHEGTRVPSRCPRSGQDGHRSRRNDGVVASELVTSGRCRMGTTDRRLCLLDAFSEATLCPAAVQRCHRARARNRDAVPRVCGWSIFALLWNWMHKR